VIFVCILQLAACAQTPLRIYPSDPIDSYNLRSNADGIKIGVKPVINKAELRHYLGTDIFSAGMLSIFVVIENTNKEGSYLVSDTTFELGKMGVQEDRNSASAGAGTAVVVGSFFTPLIVFPPAMLTGITMANNASRKNLNIERNTFPNGTLSPGETEQGFAYFKVPEDLSGELVFTVKLKKQGESEIVKTQFTFKLDMEAR
jgi:hypothetical protein